MFELLRKFSLLLLLFVASVGYMVWDGRRLEAEMQTLAAQFSVGGNAYRISVPDSRRGFVWFRAPNTSHYCLSIAFSAGQVHSARLAERDMDDALRFDDGFDLVRYSDELADCTELSIVLASNAGFLRGELSMAITDGRISEIRPILMSD